MAGLTLDLFGGFDLRLAAGPRLALSSKKAQALLAYLALSPERSPSRDKIATLLWSDRGDEQARASLRQTLSVLRRAFPDSESRIVRSSTGGLSVDPGLLKVDVTTFEACIAQGSRADLERAVEIYKGQFMDGFEIRAEPFEEWLRSERMRLSELAAKATETVLKEYRDEGNSQSALSMAKRLLRLDPLREDIHRTAMNLLREEKQWNDALKQYEQCHDVLQAELGITPQAETEALYQEILRQRSAVERHLEHRRTESRDVGKKQWPDPQQDESKPSIMVLPFENLSDDPKQNYFTDGITEDIITELSRFPDLFVIARNSSFTYKNRGVTVQEVHKDLGVQYVIKGSVRKSGNRVRVTVQLIEAESGKHVWADRYDRKLIDVFELQDELTRIIHDGHG